MIITTTTRLPPQIKQHFDRWLLDRWSPIGFQQQLQKLLERIKRKVPKSHTGRWKKLNKLIPQIEEALERYTKEKNEFERQKKAAMERPRTPSGRTTRRLGIWD